MSSKVKVSYDSEESKDLEESTSEESMAADSPREEAEESDDGDIEASEDEFGDISDDDDEFGDISDEDEDDDKPSGLANVMAKLLAKQVNDKKVILAKGKTEREILTAKQTKKDSDEDSEEETKGDEKSTDIEYAVKRAQQLKRKKWENMGRVKPTALDREREKKLQRVATRGVVQLFNAVQKQQKSLKDKLNAVGSSVRKQDKVLQAVKKGDFIDVLKRSDIKSETISKTSNDHEDDPTWSILKDDFMMGAKMKDWDKQSDSDGGEVPMEQGGDSDSE